MNPKDYNNVDLDLAKLDPENALLIQDLVSEKVNTRKSARNQLVDMGSKVLPSIYKLFNSKNELLRWEASKIIQEIASTDSIPFLISLLEAEESEIRWIAAEGMIQIGRPTVKPLLNSLIHEEGEKYYLNSGAHHVLHALFRKNEREAYKELLHTLSDKGALQETIPVLASRVLKESEF